MCPFFGTHLERHIAAKHPNTFTTKSEKMTLVHKHDKLAQGQKGKKEERKFQCTYKRCGAIITRIGQHLTRIHKLTDKKELAQVKAKCLRLSSSTSRKRKADPPAAKQPVATSAKTRPLKKKPRHDDSAEDSSDDEGSYISSGNASDEQIEEIEVNSK